MSAVPNYAERRAFGRRPANLVGYVYLPGRAGIACIIKDISEGGALLEFRNEMPLPSRVRLMREGSDSVADCEVRHQRGTSAGVQFLTEAGRQMAREMFKLNAAETPLQPAPALQRAVEAQSARGSDLVQRFRVQRTKSPEAAPVAVTVDPAQPLDAGPALVDSVPRDIFSAFERALRGDANSVPDVIPLPLAACWYAHARSSMPPRPMAACRFA